MFCIEWSSLDEIDTLNLGVGRDDSLHRTRLLIDQDDPTEASGYKIQLISNNDSTIEQTFHGYRMMHILDFRRCHRIRRLVMTALRYHGVIEG